MSSNLVIFSELRGDHIHITSALITVVERICGSKGYQKNALHATHFYFVYLLSLIKDFQHSGIRLGVAERNVVSWHKPVRQI